MPTSRKFVPQRAPTPLPDPRRCACRNLASIAVTWGKGTVFYCDACVPDEPRSPS